MMKFSISAILLFISLASGAQCLTASSGLYPAAIYTPTCTGAAVNITTAGYAGEYSKVNLLAGITYVFSSSVTTDFITISDSAGVAVYAFGTTPVSYTPTAASIIRFYTHTNSTCGESNTTFRSRAIQCTNPPCPIPTAQPSGLVFTPGLASISGTFTAASPAPTNYLVVRYAAGGGATPALPSNTTTYTTGNTITGSGLSTGTVVYAGTATSFNATGLLGGTTYDFVVFSYNTGSACSPAYYTTVIAGQNRGAATTTSCPAITSPVTVGSSGTYTSLTSIANVLSGCPIAAPLSIQLQNDYSSAGETFPITFNPIAGASAANTVIIKPAAGVTTSITGSLASGALVRILGNYITIDGSNNGSTSRNLTISNTSITSPSVVLVGSTGTTPVTNVTVKNSIIINGVNTSSALAVTDGTTLGNPGYFNNISLLNNSIQKAYIGIYTYAATAAGNGSGLTISGNDLSTIGTNAVRYVGIYAQGVDGATIANNTIGNFDAVSAEIDKGIWFATGTVNSTISGNSISNLGYTGTGANAPAAIYLSSGTATSNLIVSGNTITGLSSSGNAISSGVHVLGATAGITVEKNKISNIKNSNTAGGAYGVRLAGTATTGTITIANNFVSDVSGNGSATVANNGHGIAITAGTEYNIYYNSVNLNTNQTATTGLPAAFFVGSGVTTVGAINARNNIFVNSQTTGTERYAIYSGATNTVFAAIDYNDYFAPEGTNLGFIGSNRTDLVAVQSGFGGNINSKSIQPLFNSPTDLHLNPVTNTTLANLGTTIAGFTTDIDNQIRSATVPDMGGDEFDVIVPVTLLTFKGERKASDNLLSWVTATEVNNSGFELQRSANGIDFSKIVFVGSKASNGTSNSLLEYTYSDIKPLAGTNYYRLKQMDKDGNFTFSRVVSIKGAMVSEFIFGNLYPIPAKKSITATIEVFKATEATFVITNMEGKVMQSRQVILTAGDNQVKLNVDQLSAGSYFIKILCANGCESPAKKFIKE